MNIVFVFKNEFLKSDRVYSDRFLSVFHALWLQRCLRIFGFRLFFKGVTETSGCDKARKRVEHKLRYQPAEELRRNPANQQCAQQYADYQFPHTVAACLVFKYLLDKLFHIYGCFCV